LKTRKSSKKIKKKVRFMHNLKIKTFLIEMNRGKKYCNRKIN
jgi:hypothetical protein